MAATVGDAMTQLQILRALLQKGCTVTLTR